MYLVLYTFPSHVFFFRICRKHCLKYQSTYRLGAIAVAKSLLVFMQLVLSDNFQIKKEFVFKKTISNLD